MARARRRWLVVGALVACCRLAEGFEEWYSDVGARTIQCRTVRGRNAVGEALLFTCGTYHLIALGFLWRTSPPDCCNLTEERRVSDPGQGYVNQDSRLTLRAWGPVSGTVFGTVFLRSSVVTHNFSFVVEASLPSDACQTDHPCNGNRSSCVLLSSGTKCSCGASFPHYDPWHNVCFRGRALHETCQYNHQCVATVANSECRDGLCRCLWRSDGSVARCLPAVTLDRPCGPGVSCRGTGVRCRHYTCACMRGFVKVGDRCLPSAEKRVATTPSPVRGTFASAAVLALLVVTVLTTLALRNSQCQDEDALENGTVPRLKGSAGFTSVPPRPRLAAARGSSSCLDTGKHSSVTLETGL